MVVGAGAGILAAEGVHSYVTSLGDSIFIRAGAGAALGAAVGYLFG